MASKVDTYKGRLHMLLLYPDNTEHAEALDRISKGYEHAMVFHDQDKFTAEDEKKNPNNKEGELKKPHYHCVIRFPHARWNTAIAKELGIDVRFVEQVKNFDNALLYLIHYNDDNKFKYKVEDVTGGLKKRLIELLAATEKSDTDIVRELFTFIMDNDCYISNSLMLSIVLESGYLAVYRRNYHILNNLLKEHNSRFTEDEAKEAVTAFEYGYSEAVEGCEDSGSETEATEEAEVEVREDSGSETEATEEAEVEVREDSGSETENTN